MRWFSLIETLDHIGLTQKCTSVEAQRNLKAKIGLGIIPVKWADAEGANDSPDPRYLQGTKLRLSGAGLAHDKDSDAYRPLLALRSAVLAACQHAKGGAEPSKEVVRAKQPAPNNKHENEQMEWMTLVEAEEHIEVLQKCDSFEALRQLKEEIGDGMVAMKWADGATNRTEKPNVSILKDSQMIPAGPGFALDGKEYRPLMILRADVLRLWPESCDPVEQMPAEQSNSKSGQGRPSARDEIMAALSEMQCQKLLPLNGSQKQIAKDVAKKCGHEIGSRGWSERTVKQHISDWQKENTPADPKKMQK